MGKLYAELTPKLVEFIEAQQLFFVGTAPLAADGHVNLSPKGKDSLRVLGPHSVAYADLTGSGIETVAHLKENGRMVMMFCAFSGRPLILRLHGRGEVLETDHTDFAALLGRFGDTDGVRAIIRLEVTRIADSCGWMVPQYEPAGMRDYYEKYLDKLGPEGLRQGQLEANMASIDGLPGLARPSV